MPSSEQSYAIYGIHAVLSAIQHRHYLVRECLVHNMGNARLKDIVALCAQHDIKLRVASDQELDQRFAEKNHQGVAIYLKDLAQTTGRLEDLIDRIVGVPLLLILDCIQDPHNLGACFRVADAMGVHAIIAPRKRSVGLTDSVHKVACGATQTVPFFQVTNLARTLRMLKDKGLWIIGTNMMSTLTLQQCDLKKPVALILGGEASGMRHLTTEHCDEIITIPMMGCINSLNVSVAAGICLYELMRQRT